MISVESFNLAVRGLIALVLVAVLCTGFLKHEVSAEAFIGIVGLAVGWWYGRGQAEQARVDQVADQARVDQRVDRAASLQPRPPEERKP